MESSVAAGPEAPEMPGTSTDLTTIKEAASHAALSRVISDDELRRLWRHAAALAKSGMFKDVQSAEMAFAKIVIGRDFGLSPAQSMVGIHLVEGKPMLAYTLLGAFVRENGYDYKVTELTRESCTVVMVGKDGEELGTSDFSMDDARQAGVVRDKSGWTKYPRNMLVARALSNGVRWFCPEVMGGMPVYVEGEIVPAPALTDGQGNGEAQGLDLGPKVEAVLERAKELAHEGLADRATAEMALGHSTPAEVDEWVVGATAVLDAIDPEKQERADEEPVERSDVELQGATTDEVKVCGVRDSAGRVCIRDVAHDGSHFAGDGEGSWGSVEEVTPGEGDVEDPPEPAEGQQSLDGE